VAELKEKAKEIRKLTLACIGSLGMGHVGGSLSIADLLAVLYFDRMRIDPARPDWRERDRLVVSKGHAGPAVYAALALKGYFDLSWLDTLNRPYTRLPSHCDMNRTPGIDMTTGSLGQGLSAAVGMALAARLDKNPCRIFVILGDGDNQEGQTWEAAMFAAQKGLDRLVAFTDKNDLQIDDTVDHINTLGDLAARWRAFGWHALDVADGHDVGAILAAMDQAGPERSGGKPAMIVLHTIKGKGAAFAEGRLDSHHTAVTEEQWRDAVAALG
jgi:transketolase